MAIRVQVGRYRYSATVHKTPIPSPNIPNCVILYLYKAIVKALTQIITGHSS